MKLIRVASMAFAAYFTSDADVASIRKIFSGGTNEA